SLFQRIIHRQDWQNVKAACQQAKNGIAQHIYYRIHRNQEVCWVEERMIPKFDEHDVVTSIVSVCYDITRFKQQETEIWNLAMHDTVTNLPNRSHFMSELQQWIQRHEQVAVLTLSFNSIHPINRDFGYTVGDDWITATANALTDHLSADSFVGYLGGDDYGILVPNLANEQEVIQFCQSLIRRSERYITVGPYEWSPTVSVGVSRYPHDADQPNMLLQYAHTALGRTRLHGADPIVFYASTFDIDSFRKHQLGNDLRHAIEEGELFLEFQPKVDIWSGRLVGAEALVRWQHPEWGRIPPSDFIALSEETDLHIALSDWVLKETCRQLQEWKNRHLAVVPISINISPKRLLHKTYSETVLRILRQYDLSPSLLEIEILETGILSDNVKIHESLNQLNEAGIRIALDDFGTGYSSLSYLQRYPIKTIKIDQQFVKDLHDSKKTQGIVRTILFMSEEFDIDVLIEGVET
ncbi:putative bifunctional diguanylate cyclase/phosphodiesterase, partial [Exiguobacterium sp. B2(2022)]|uniref:putative bifunctional diguanylate cyclase/phosphodiesterase n=1 Tax=Exiguobacterium sp. B2(2022) TaxID=2992755 RepID=UPI00237B8868